MANKFTSFRFAEEQLSLEKINRDYRISLEAIKLLFSNTANFSNLAYIPGFYFKSITELEKEEIQETEFQACFKILTMIEAKLRTDFIIRVNKGRNDPLADSFREIVKNHKDLYPYQFSLEEAIINNWKNLYPEYRNLLGTLNSEISKFRHWVAHGRYWNPKNWNLEDYSFDLLFHQASIFENTIGQLLYNTN